MAAPRQASMTVTVPGHPAKPRPVDFVHARHTMKKCVDCHTTPVTLAPAPAIAQCKDCHSDHHAEGRTCSSCHALGRPEGGAHIARGGASAVRRVPHGDDRRRADAHAHVLQHLPRGKGRESLPAEGMQRLPFPRLTRAPIAGSSPRHRDDAASGVDDREHARVVRGAGRRAELSRPDRRARSGRLVSRARRRQHLPPRTS